MWLCALFLFFADRDAEMSAKLVPGLAELKPVQAKIAAEDLPKLDRALGSPFEPFSKKSRVYTASSKKETLRIAFVPALGGDLGVAADAEGNIAGIAWFPESFPAKPDPGWEKFFQQFQGTFAKRFQASLQLPAAQLEEKMKLTVSPADETAKRLQFLLRQKSIMRKNEELYLFLSDRLESKEDLKAKLGELRQSMEEFVALAPSASAVLEEKAVTRYKKTAEESRAVLAQAIASYERGNRASAKQILDEDLQDSCSKCHGWDGHSLRKPLQSAMRELRGDLGIGDGYFQVGFDVEPLAADKAKESQEMAKALQGALLLLKGAG